ncbi:MAG: hypothetical protein OWQ54_00285 [Sulfolobaceae archaeon]|nr:hypothetical protein [Sulfolobaceae archaeon]
MAGKIRSFDRSSVFTINIPPWADNPFLPGLKIFARSIYSLMGNNSYFAHNEGIFKLSRLTFFMVMGLIIIGTIIMILTVSLAGLLGLIVGVIVFSGIMSFVSMVSSKRVYGTLIIPWNEIKAIRVENLTQKSVDDMVYLQTVEVGDWRIYKTDGDEIIINDVYDPISKLQMLKEKFGVAVSE